MRLTALVALVGFVVVPPAATAQPMPTVAATNTRIFVTPATGGPLIAGSLLSLTAESVALLVGGDTRTLPLHGVKRIEREGDPTGDGVQKGALLLGLACFLMCGQGVSNGGEFGRVIVSNMVIGGLIGWQLDRDHIGRSQIYPVTQGSRDTAAPR